MGRPVRGTTNKISMRPTKLTIAGQLNSAWNVLSKSVFRARSLQSEQSSYSRRTTIWDWFLD